MHERENKKKLVGDRVLVKHVLIIKILYLLISFFYFIVFVELKKS